MINNPLKRPILNILKEAHTPLKEYDLHCTLGHASFNKYLGNCSANLVLFRKHFLVMNALYSLHDELLEQGWYLQISALEIKLLASNHLPQPSDKADTTLSTENGFQKLSHYYQDWRNFEQTSEQDVSALLDSFWKNYLSHDEQDKSLICLGFEPEDTIHWPAIHKRYQQLCQQHHPDKGGNGVYFIEIRQAYDNLKSLYKT